MPTLMRKQSSTSSPTTTQRASSGPTPASRSRPIASSAYSSAIARCGGELSYRGGITDGTGRVSAEWRALFQRFPDRFVLGSDTWINERWSSYGEIMAGYRAWLADLPADLARNIAHRNAETLFAA